MKLLKQSCLLLISVVGVINIEFNVVAIAQSLPTEQIVAIPSSIDIINHCSNDSVIEKAIILVGQPAFDKFQQISQFLLSSQELANLIVQLYELANTKTQKDFPQFISEKYIANSDYQINNGMTRVWYNHFDAQIKPLVQKLILPKYAIEQLEQEDNLRTYAELISQFRTHARDFTRAHMSDQELVKKLEVRDHKKYGLEHAPEFADFVQKNAYKVMNKNSNHCELTDYKKIYYGIIDSASRTDWLANQVITCYQIFPNYACDFLAHSFF